MNESELADVIAGWLSGRDVDESGAYMMAGSWPLGSKTVDVVIFGPDSGSATQRFKLTVEEVTDW